MNNQISKGINLEVYTTNEFNRVVKLELAHIMPLLVAFIGKKIFTLKGRAKIFEVAFLQPKVIAFDGGFAQINMCYLDNQYNKLVLRFKLCFNGGSYETTPRTAYTQYLERTIELGELENNEKLLKLYDLNNIIASYGFDTVLDLEDEIKAIEEYAKLKALAEKAKSKIKVSSDMYRYV